MAGVISVLSDNKIKCTNNGVVTTFTYPTDGSIQDGIAFAKKCKSEGGIITYIGKQFRGQSKYSGFVSDRVIDNSYLNAGGIIDVTKQCGVKNPLPCMGKNKAECLAKKSAFESCASAVRAGVAQGLGATVTPTARQEQTLNEQLGIGQSTDTTTIQPESVTPKNNPRQGALMGQLPVKTGGLKTGIIIGVVVIVGVIGFIVYKRMKK